MSPDSHGASRSGRHDDEDHVPSGPAPSQVGRVLARPHPVLDRLEIARLLDHTPEHKLYPNRPTPVLGLLLANAMPTPFRFLEPTCSEIRPDNQGAISPWTCGARPLLQVQLPSSMASKRMIEDDIKPMNSPSLPMLPCPRGTLECPSVVCPTPVV